MLYGVARAERTGTVLTDALQTNPENRTLLPRMAFTGFASRYRQPTLLEGFTDITTVHFRVSTHQPRGTGAIKTHANQVESSMALKSRGRYGASIGFSRRDLGGTDRVWVIPRRREKRVLTTLVHNEKRKDRTGGLQGWVRGRAYSSRTRWLRLFGNSRAKVGSHTAAT
jgi:hypothetical protein